VKVYVVEGGGDGDWSIDGIYAHLDAAIAHIEQNPKVVKDTRHQDSEERRRLYPNQVATYRWPYDEWNNGGGTAFTVTEYEVK